MQYRLSWDIVDGKLDYDTGRIVVFRDMIVRSNGPSRDHNDLITTLAARYRVPRSDVASRGYRFYWRPERRGLITISPVRKLDEDWACDHINEFNSLIDAAFGKH
jgi:hypothetical protein